MKGTFALTTIAALLGMSSLTSTANAEPDSNVYTGTGLDTIINIIYSDPGLAANVTPEGLDEAAASAGQMNDIIIEAIRGIHAADDGMISKSDVRQMNYYIRARYTDLWATLHGDDENGVETGYHLVQHDGCQTELYGENAIDTVGDQIYHIGFERVSKEGFRNEDGTTGSYVRNIAIWLNYLLANDLEAGTLK